MGIIEDLEKLKQLKDNGTITDIEFEIEKQKVLNDGLNKKNNKDKKETLAMVGFILGIVSIIAWYIPLIGFPVTVGGIIFCGLGLNSNNHGKAIAGLILSIIFLVVTLINSALGVILYSSFYYL
jgi:hypothetical protein